jgi:hypothetical protein
MENGFISRGNPPEAGLIKAAFGRPPLADGL